MSTSNPTFLGRNASIREAISSIDLSQAKIAIVVDGERRLLGTVTDGDIRRGILRGASLEDPVTKVMNEHPTVAKDGQSRQQVEALMRRERFRQMPVVDADRRVVRVDTLAESHVYGKRNNPVVLMAGGIGARLQPLTAERPKPLLKVGDRPILESIIKSFAAYGFERFFISVNYKKEMVESHFGDGSRWGVSIEYLREDKPLGTAGALSLLPEIPNAPLVLMNGDILTNINFDSLLTYHAEHGAAATVAVREYALPVQYGVIDVDGDRLVGIREKPVYQLLVNAGIYVLEPSALSIVPKDSVFDMPQLFNGLVREQKRVCVFPVREYWIDIGQMQDFERANGEYETVFG